MDMVLPEDGPKHRDVASPKVSGDALFADKNQTQNEKTVKPMASGDIVKKRPPYSIPRVLKEVAKK